MKPYVVVHDKTSMIIKRIIKLLLGAKSRAELQFLCTLKFYKLISTVQLMKESRSQLKQDIFALSENNFKEEGFFVEFGALDGINLSNTWLLENKLNWTGILAEPARTQKSELQKNRPNAMVCDLCVWKDSKSSLSFIETTQTEFSTINSFVQENRHCVEQVANNLSYEVLSISLVDMLRKYKAPRNIDYLSIDTEGSEYEILNAFDFKEYSFNVITVEHNYTPQRELIFDLLTNNGYKRKFEKFSMHDDWYVKKN
jgi:FkbM family methyltransferase